MAMNEAYVPCLSGIVELQQECEKQAFRLSEETRKYLVYQMLKSFGPRQSHKFISKLVTEGIITWDNEFEVESVLDHWKDHADGQMYYHIKWNGWSHKHDTWEPEKNLRCEELLKEYNILVRKGTSRKRKAQCLARDEDERVLRMRRINDLFTKLMDSEIMDTLSPVAMVTYYTPVKKRSLRKGLPHAHPRLQRKKTSQRKLLHHEVQKALKDWENSLNKIIKGYDPAPVTVENTFDLEGPPDNFIYINERKEGPGVVIPKDPLIGCECDDCYACRKTCCPASNDSNLAYYKSTGRLRAPRGIPIFECNFRCKCGPDCLNRVAQNGRKFKLCIYRTKGRGWGVKTLQRIKKGAFVVEYVGEVITNEEAERRGKEYDAAGRTYLFDLDFHEANAPFAVDAGTYGNAAHFINHSCDPNLEVHVVWINTLDPRLPHICLYAKRDIEKNEELTFDYMSGNLMLEEQEASFEEQSDMASESPSVDEKHGCSSNSKRRGTEEGDKLEQPEEFLWAVPDIEKVRPTRSSLREFLDRKKPDSFKASSDSLFTGIKDLPTPPSSDTESITAGSTDGTITACKQSKFSMACLCGASNCRKFLFF